jgi:hypothetical protein
MVVEKQVAKLTIVPFSDQEFVRPAGLPWIAMFNPGELSFSRKNHYNNSASAGTSQPQTSFGNGEPDEITLDLFFDGSGVVATLEPVPVLIERLLFFTKFQPDTHQPYYLLASWGPWNFLGVMTAAKVTYKVFDRNGVPVRATVSVTLQEVVAPVDMLNLERRSSPDLHQSWLVQQGETLDLIASQVYGAPEYWRPLALVNGLVNPRALVPGSRLRLPPKATA